MRNSASATFLYFMLFYSSYKNKFLMVLISVFVNYNNSVTNLQLLKDCIYHIKRQQCLIKSHSYFKTVSLLLTMLVTEPVDLMMHDTVNLNCGNFFIFIY